MFKLTVAVSALAALAGMARADTTPIAPGPGDTFKEGGACTIQWTADTTGVWKQMYIELMTGDNFNMVHLTTVGQFDGTDSKNETYSYPCPNVTPNSAIYFYQFTTPESKSVYWTGRFAIADPTGATTPPTNATQPGTNATIPWGTGAFVDPTQATAPPPAPGSALTGSSSASVSASVAPASSMSAPAVSSVAISSKAASGTGAPAATATSAAGRTTVAGLSILAAAIGAAIIL